MGNERQGFGMKIFHRIKAAVIWMSYLTFFLYIGLGGILSAHALIGWELGALGNLSAMFCVVLASYMLADKFTQGSPDTETLHRRKLAENLSSLPRPAASDR